MAIAHQFVLVPRVTANDDQAILVAWTAADGSEVSEGDVICELEYSKSVVEVPATRSGWLFRLHEEGTEVAVGKPVAIISESAERPQLDGESSAESLGIKVTAKARALIESHGLDLLQFQGIEIVKQKHVLDYLEKRQPAADQSTEEGELRPLTPIRRRTAMTLTESAQTVPHSYLVHWLPAKAVDERLEALAKQQDMLISLSDLVVATVARRAAEFRKVNASWRGNGIFEHARVHVGFALNQASGDLLVPVIHDADRMELEQLVGRIRGLQKKAMRHKLTPEDLAGGTITVTSLLGTEVHQVYPILVPGQAAILAIADRCPLPGVEAYALTLGFDHRVLNGSEAAEFLAAVAGGVRAEA